MKWRHIVLGSCLAVGVVVLSAASAAVANYNPWSQAGDDTYAEGPRGRSRVTGAAFSGAGDRYAMAEDRFADDRGRIRVFDVIDDTWSQVGSDIIGEDRATGIDGRTINMSTDGRLIAFATRREGISSRQVRVFEERNGDWVQRGASLTGVTANDGFGSNVGMSGDGRMLAVASDQNELVRMFRFANDAWSQVGDDIEGLVNGDQFGGALALSADGQTVAVGAIRSSATGIFSTGQVRVFHNVADQWTQLGRTFNGEVHLDELGGDLALSENGRTLAITSRKGTDEAFNGPGGLDIYELVDSQWTQIGATMLGPDFSSSGDDAVSLSADGNVVAWGTPRRVRGEVNVLSRVGDSWVPVSPPITGSGPGVMEDTPPTNRFGIHVGLSQDGSSLMIASALSAEDVDPNRRGYVRVYQRALCGGAVPTLVGTPGDDVLTGTSGPDVIVGLQGNDTIRGLGGDDIICAGIGDDVIIGGTGFDVMFGAQGNDTIYFANGQLLDQRADSAGGRAFGGAGNDDIYGSERWDRMQGGSGNDRLFGFGGRDWIRAGPGADKITGGANSDTIHGGDGNDRIVIDGPDAVRGGAGNADVCVVRSGNPISLISCEGDR